MARRHASGKKPSGGGSGSGGNTYWIWGRHACAAAMENPERRIRRILASKDMASAITPEKEHPAVEVLDHKAIEAHTGQDAVHQGVAMEVFPLEPLDIEDVLGGDAPLVVLDQVTDPHNVGAILRSAAAFGACAVVQPRDHAAPQSGVMARAACGALDLVPLVYVTNLARALEDAKRAGYWVAGLDGEADTPLHAAKLARKTALVLGAEGKGMRRLTMENCDLLVKLPMDARMESLNVSNAAAIALYELHRAG